MHAELFQEFELPPAKRMRRDIDFSIADVAINPVDDEEDFYGPSLAAQEGNISGTSAIDSTPEVLSTPAPELFILPGLGSLHEAENESHTLNPEVAQSPNAKQATPSLRDFVAPPEGLGGAKLSEVPSASPTASKFPAAVVNGQATSIHGDLTPNAAATAQISVYDMEAQLKDNVSSTLIGETSVEEDVSATCGPATGEARTATANHLPIQTKMSVEGPSSTMVIDQTADSAEAAADAPSSTVLMDKPATPAVKPFPDAPEEAESALARASSTANGGFSTELTIKDKEAEFKDDSSPCESSSDYSSESSSEDSDDDYEMLDAAEQARRLMEDDGGSDDEGGKKGKGGGSLRTQNERMDEIVEKPDVVLTPETKIEELGRVETIVDNVVLIKANTTGEYQVLETSSVLCLENRNVIGAVAETLGRVQEPLYIVRFTNARAVSEAGVWKDSTIFYVPSHSTFVFTRALKAVKGSDASNLHDEEVGDDEIEFSDDEAEATYKRDVKQQKQTKREGRGGFSNGTARQPRTNGFKPNASPDPHAKLELNYDDANAEDLYTPLVRPTGMAEVMRHGGAATEFPREPVTRPDRGRGREGRGRGDRGRGDRARGDRARGGRGRGRGVGEQRENNRHPGRQPGAIEGPDLSLPPLPPHGLPQRPSFAGVQPSTLNLPQYQPSYSPPIQPVQAYTPAPPYGQLPHNFQPPQPILQNYNVPPQQWPQQGQYAQQYGMQHHQSPISPPLPPGAFVNPAFFARSHYSGPPQQFPPYPNQSQSPFGGFANGQR